MKIYVDGDACPRVVKDILYRAAERRGVDLVMVANSYLRTPPHPTISNVVVSSGADIADDKIVELCEKGDLVITADIPLADRVIKKDAFALNPRGELYTEENIGSRLAVRDLLEDLRNSGMDTGGPSAFSASDKQEFANAFDKFMSKNFVK
jgi:uncharacterized protein YaiI (UPF0178 family)